MKNLLQANLVFKTTSKFYDLYTKYNTIRHLSFFGTDSFYVRSDGTKKVKNPLQSQR
jgi:hypothetical protein